jgi:hypothetical protein
MMLFLYKIGIVLTWPTECIKWQQIGIRLKKVSSVFNEN